MLPFIPALFVSSMVKSISTALWALSDNFSSPSGQGISININKLTDHFSKWYIEINELILKGEKESPLLRIFWNTCCGVSSLKGGIPVRNSNKQTPSAHQSTAGPGI